LGRGISRKDANGRTRKDGKEGFGEVYHFLFFFGVFVGFAFLRAFFDDVPDFFCYSASQVELGTQKNTE
jgi:hypothetical protein